MTILRLFGGKSLAIFNVVAGGASIAGFVLTATTNLPHAHLVLEIVFGISLLLSLYVLLVPETPLEKNVRSKIERYSLPVQGSKPETVEIQRGDFSIIGFGPVSVEFESSFSTAPDVEIINLGARPRIEV